MAFSTRFRFRHLPRFLPGALGDVWYRAANGDLVALPIPGDAGTVNYVLGIVAGVPAWIASGAIVGSAGYAWLYMTTVDSTGATVLATDDDGSPILTYAPV